MKTDHVEMDDPGAVDEEHAPAAEAVKPQAEASGAAVTDSSVVTESPVVTEPEAEVPGLVAAKSESESVSVVEEEPAGDALDTADEPSSTIDEPVSAAEAPEHFASRQAWLWPPRTTKARILMAAVLVVVLGLGVSGYLWFSTRLPEGVAFRVQGTDVTEKELEDQVRTLSALYGVKAPTEPSRLDTFRRDVAKSTAVAMVIDNAAAARHIGVADKQVSDFLGQYVAQYYGDGQAGRDAYIKDLADKGTSEVKVLAELKRQMVVKELFTQVTAGVTVTDQDVRTTFDQRKAEFATPERREIHNIVVNTKDEADQLLAELKAGGNFEALAQQRSLDGSTRNEGGNLGLISARELEKPYADAAFSAPVGSLFGPVQTQFGFNVGKVVQSQPPGPADFEKIKDGIRRLVLSERADAKWRAFLTDEIKNADVIYADRYRPADPNGLPPAQGDEQPAAPPAGQPAPSAQPPAPAPTSVQPPK